VSQNSSVASVWYVYIVICADKTLYTGVSTDLARRIKEHNESSHGAKYTRSRRPVELVMSRTATSKSSAFKCEAAIKKQKRMNKIKTLKNWKFE